MEKVIYMGVPNFKEIRESHLAYGKKVMMDILEPRISKELLELIDNAKGAKELREVLRWIFFFSADKDFNHERLFALIFEDYVLLEEVYCYEGTDTYECSVVANISIDLEHDFVEEFNSSSANLSRAGTGSISLKEFRSHPRYNRFSMFYGEEELKALLTREEVDYMMSTKFECETVRNLGSTKYTEEPDDDLFDVLHDICNLFSEENDDWEVVLNHYFEEPLRRKIKSWIN